MTKAEAIQEVKRLVGKRGTVKEFRTGHAISLITKYVVGLKDSSYYGITPLANGDSWEQALENLKHTLCK